MDRPVFFGGWQRKEVVGCSSELGHRVDFQPMVLEFDETERGEARSEVRGGGGGGEIDEWDHTVIVGAGGPRRRWLRTCRLSWSTPDPRDNSHACELPTTFGA